jgi:hypothetical protein
MKKIWVVKDREEKCYKEFKTKNAADRFARKEANRLDRETPEDVETAYDAFFAQGTYDQVHTQNLVTQRHMFHLINDGIADSTILREDQIGFRGFEINGASEALAI